jgi:5-methylcytosine-specific restriction endonuclease McrA
MASRKKNGKHLRMLLKHHKACYYCGEDFTDKRWPTIDHKQPLSRGGGNEKKNLCACCSECNQKKGCLTEEEFMAVSKGK